MEYSFKVTEKSIYIASSAEFISSCLHYEVIYRETTASLRNRTVQEAAVLPAENLGEHLIYIIVLKYYYGYFGFNATIIITVKRVVIFKIFTKKYTAVKSSIRVCVCVCVRAREKGTPAIK